MSYPSKLHVEKVYVVVVEGVNTNQISGLTVPVQIGAGAHRFIWFWFCTRRGIGCIKIVWTRNCCCYRIRAIVSIHLRTLGTSRASQQANTKHRNSFKYVSHLRGIFLTRDSAVNHLLLCTHQQGIVEKITKNNTLFTDSPAFLSPKTDSEGSFLARSQLDSESMNSLVTGLTPQAALLHAPQIVSIGVTGFEPATSCSQNKRSAKLSYTPHCSRFHGHSTSNKPH